MFAEASHSRPCVQLILRPVNLRRGPLHLATDGREWHRGGDLAASKGFEFQAVRVRRRMVYSKERQRAVAVNLRGSKSTLAPES